MTMPFLIEWVLVTKGKEKRLTDQENMFQITLEGYRIFPIHQTIDIKRYNNSDQIGRGEILELTLKNNQTICKYRLVSLHSVN
ncbi:DUF2584 domain-containing protein [Aquibacillus sp. 3ASR75-11]|uniref:DUF2584 domain-containing protein n=1 Tax=Terrihalobacillus insolitus TaxID=2950438 RepID=A0A9X3WS40_9BACI|nr:DUF2584 family protein [Terrihalobacillus insolitus]MDC3412977.1 DUF2584 domain-containing protein [Terrihalobacillus insolitus]MDC3424730.1 DUF2584 domain-containing protein [Terrihalobacillus insolitus]